jgi:hypothetical protein
MKITPVLLVCFAFAGCGGGGDSEQETDRDPATRATATPQKSEDPEAEVRKVFDGYNDALESRDWDAACERLAPETTAKLRENLKALGDANPPEECEKLFDQLYTAIDKQPAQKQLVDEILKTAELDSVKVSGDKATVNWHATVQGSKRAISQTARKIDGEWKLVDVTN